MSEDAIKQILKEVGLTATEIEVYLFLSKHGVLKGTEIAKRIKKDKGQIYQLLKSLQTKGIVQATSETPIRYTPIPFEKVVELTINTKREDATRLERSRQELLNYWKNKNKDASPSEKKIITATESIEQTTKTKTQNKTKNKLVSVKSLSALVVAIVVILVASTFIAIQPGSLGVSNLPTANPSATKFISPFPSSSTNPSCTVLSTPSPSAGLTISPTISPTVTPNPSPLDSFIAKFYDTPTISADGTSVSLPFNFVQNNRIVNLDIKLKTPLTSATIGGRNVTLLYYRDGNYLPLMLLFTPQQQLIAAIRVCEPCHTYSFSIVDGVLQCDAICHTRWNLETFEGLSGTCAKMPPPKLQTPSIVGDSIVVDLSELQIVVTP